MNFTRGEGIYKSLDIGVDRRTEKADALNKRLQELVEEIEFRSEMQMKARELQHKHDMIEASR